MISLENVTKRYGDFTAVSGLSLSVQPGEVFGLLGPNGAGKTTSLRMMAGILAPTSGRILVGGHDILHDSTAAKQQLGFIPDRPFVYEKLTGWEYLRFVAGLYGLWKGEDTTLENRATELLSLFDLNDWRHELIESYSHGMRQKLIISAALLHRPRVMVVDEPMVGLDPRAARTLKELFREYARRGNTVVVSTHTLAVAEEMCDRVGIVQHGTLRATGSMDELRADAVTAGDGLEEIFLRLTGEKAARSLSQVLDA